MPHNIAKLNGHYVGYGSGDVYRIAGKAGAYVAAGRYKKTLVHAKTLKALSELL